MRQLVLNSIQTPDGTVLISRHRHDYVTHIDKNGKEYMVDGGRDYFRRSANGDEIDLCVYADEPFGKVRQAFCRGSRGKDGDEELTYVKLCDMSGDYLQTVLKYYADAYPELTFEEAMDKLRENELGNLYLLEIEYRKER